MNRTKTPTDLVSIQVTPPTIIGNFDEIEARLREQLRRFDIVVNPAELTEAKRLRTELRKQTAELNRRIKEALADVAAPIREAEERRKALKKLGEEVDAKIKEQIDRCEAQTKEEVARLLSLERHALYQRHGVRTEFHCAEYDDLVKMTGITGKGKLAKSTRETLESRVLADRSLQDRTDRRLAELTSASLDADLAAPLTRPHVEHFLFEPDDAYGRHLRQLLDTEIDRQAKAEQRARERQEREAQQKADAERRENERQERLRQEREAADAREKERQQRAADEAVDVTEDEDEDVRDNVIGFDVQTRSAQHERHEQVVSAMSQEFARSHLSSRKRWRIKATFEVSVPERATPAQIGQNFSVQIRKTPIGPMLRSVSCEEFQDET
jgi:hypothetical protein